MRRRSRSRKKVRSLPPWLRIRRLPGVVPVALGLFLLLIALLKIPMMSALCGPDPWEDANGIMIVVELACGVMFLRPQLGRRVAALFWAALMPWVAAFLVYMHHRGFDVEGCGCFGPVRLGLGTHFAVIAGLFAIAAAVFLREETRVSDRAYGPEAGDRRALRRLVGPFE
jgi:hypothetical protein